MASLGSRILMAFQLLATNPALVAQVAALTDDDAKSKALLDTLGMTTTQLAADVATLQASLAANDNLDDEQAAKLQAISDTIDSLNAAFPDTDQAPPDAAETDQAPGT